MPGALNPSLNVAVAVASLGRPGNVATLVERLARQTVLPHQVLLSVESEADLPSLDGYTIPIDYVCGPRGLPAQRNRALRQLRADADVVVFYDDDFVPSRFAIAGVSRFFASHPEVMGADGLVLVDGIIGPGISPEAAEQIVNQHDARGEAPSTSIVELRRRLYGCNMAYRLSGIRGLEFDEELPFYAWLEDNDFSGRVPGLTVRTDAFAGVHCGEKRGRESNGTRLGYSQIANPVYMARKGSLSWRGATYTMARNVTMNHLKLLRPEPWFDRKGRATGNWLAVGDLLRGVITPSRITRL